jgi:hypothetical protein
MISLVLGYVDEEGRAAAWAVQLTRKKDRASCMAAGHAISFQ